jgi:hypothetical protein
LRDNDAMTILSIPKIVVLETVDIDVQTVRIHVHVGHEIAQHAIFNTTALTPIARKTAEYHLGHKSPPARCTNFSLFI